MNPCYKKEKDSDYMILEAPGKPDGSEYQIRMLLLNTIPGILRCKMRRMDGVPEFYYNVTEKQPMTRMFEKKLMGREEIQKLLEGLESAMDQAGRYLLEMNQFVLKPDYIFQSTDTGEFFFCYLPFYEGELEADFRELAEYILKRLDHSQEEAVLWGYEIYSRSMEENFSLGKILESVYQRGCREEKEMPGSGEEEFDLEEYCEENECREEEQEECPRKTEEPREEIPKEPMKTERKQETLKTGSHKDKKARSHKTLIRKAGKAAAVIMGCFLAFGVSAFAVWSQGLNFIQAGGILFLSLGVLAYFTMVFQRKPKKKEDQVEELIREWSIPHGEERTVCLGAALDREHPVLVSMEPDKRENMVLDKPKLTVGKQKGQVDLLLDEPTVSRIHAIFEKHSDGWYMKDCHSTNGTFINGRRLPQNGRKKLEEGMEISFSCASFYFHDANV